MNNTIKCPNCASESIIKRGQRKTQNRGLIQRYSCQDCDKRFVVDDGFFKMKNSPQKVTFCIDLFYRGVSTRQIQEHLQAFSPHNSSWVSIYKWIVKYSKQISSFTDKLKVQPIKELQVDEMEIGSKKSRYSGWFIDSIDTESRYMVASAFTKTRELKEIKKILSTARQKTDNQIQICTTDGYTAYEHAVKKVFGYNRKLARDRTIHNKVTQLKGEGFNHKIERMHNSIRHRIKTFRGFHSLVPSNELMKGYRIYYNFIRKHQAINKCPYELATNIKLTSENKWLQLIQLAKDFKNENN
jgi:transposase-like protein